MTKLSDITTISTNPPQEEITASSQKAKISTRTKNSGRFSPSPMNASKRSYRPMRSMMGIKSLRPKSLIKVESISQKT